MGLCVLLTMTDSCDQMLFMVVVVSPNRCVQQLMLRDGTNFLKI